MKNEFIFKSFLEELNIVTEKYHESIALTYNNKALTYSELNERIISVSLKLKQTGILKGDIVVLWMSKSIEYIILILSLWKLGAVFLPLDKKTPKGRVSWILKDADAKMLITDNEDYFHEMDFGIKIFDKNYFFQKIESYFENANESVILKSQDTAYIIYTSGSMGNPKGVVVTHEGIVNFLKEQIQVFEVTNKSIVLQYLSIGFDASLSEIGFTLLSGGKLRIQIEEVLKDVDKLFEVLEEERITHICLPPALLSVLNIKRLPDSLRTIIIGGEVCPVEIVRAWSERFRIINVYGPTEATVCSSMVVCEPNWNKPLIGYPIRGRKFHVLDRNNFPVKIGEIGELHLSGIGLAKGYVNQRELTKEKFIFLNNLRMYKTGDLVRLHSKEEIEFIGRMDRQFKLNGNLIEPLEVEQSLCAHSSISFSYVMKKKKNREYLVAYILLKDKQIQSREKELSKMLRDYLRKLLPYWMIPEKFILLNEIPLNTNGKLAIEKFPEINSDREFTLDSNSIPQNEKEKQLCEIFERLLMISPIGIDDNFYDLGGDSLTTISLLTECRIIGISPSLEVFLNNPTVRGILSENEIYDTKFTTFLSGESKLNEEILKLIKKVNKKKEEISKVLFTGSTGFLGSRVLWELIQNEDIEFYCIVRDFSELSPRKKIENHLRMQGLEIKKWDRIKFIEGDISLVKFKLDELDWEYLAANIDCVVHFAAEINLVKTYADLKRNNVDATKEILKFCLTGIHKTLHYASTLSVFVSTDTKRNIFYEEDRLNSINEVYGGYAQSKWVSEKILLNAIELGIDSIKIYRFGLITGDTKFGYAKQDDFFTRFIKALYLAKILPIVSEMNLKVDVTPLDFAAGIFSQLFQNAANQNIFHIANTNSLSIEKLKTIFKKLNVKISEVTEKEFLDFFKKSKNIDPFLLLSISRVFMDKNKIEKVLPFDLFQATERTFDFTNVKKVIPDYEEICPEPNFDLLQIYLQHIKI